MSIKTIGTLDLATRIASIKSISSDATNTYDLLTDVCRVFRAEPKRCDMGAVRVVSTGFRNYRYNAEDFPSCGTVGCIAGWAATIGDFRSLDKGDLGFYAMAEIAQWMGLSEAQWRELFIPETLIDTHPRAIYGTRRQLERETGGTQLRRPQTRQHVRDVIRHVKAFQAKYADQLRAHTLAR